MVKRSLWLLSLFLLLPFVLLLIVLLGIGYSEGGVKGGVKKAKTVDELIKMFDYSSCIQCHQKEYEEWSKSFHAFSLVGSMRTLASWASTIRLIIDGKTYPYAKATRVEDLKVEHLMMCAKCHLPQLKYAEDSVAVELAKLILSAAEGDEKALEKVKQLNINCLICHQEVAIVHKWRDGFVDRSAVYGKREGFHPDPKYGKLKKSPIIDRAVFCGQCHGLGPNFEFPHPSQCATAYGSYLHAYIPSGGTKTCQDCHMREDNLGHLMPAYRDKRMAKKAVDYSVEVIPYSYLHKPGVYHNKARVVVKMTNKAGHRIPDG
jgi:nitrate/TMAO reductase-like tetraheme cytochrome c subunit